MDKSKFISVSTRRHQEKDNIYIVLRNQIEQRLHEATATPEVGTSGAATAPTTVVSSTLSEVPTYYTIDGIVLFDNTGLRWGEIVNGIPVGDSSFLTEIQIHAVLSRINSTTFELPTGAQYVTDVWFDDLKAEPINHYSFISPTTISTVSSLGVGIIVTAFYLNDDVVL